MIINAITVAWSLANYNRIYLALKWIYRIQPSPAIGNSLLTIIALSTYVVTLGAWDESILALLTSLDYLRGYITIVVINIDAQHYLHYK